MKLEISPFSLRLKTPIQTARGLMDERSGFRVELRAQGVVGRGDAMPMASFGTETPEASLMALERLTIPQIPNSVEEISQVVNALRHSPAARHAAECALLEHLAIRQGVLVATLLGPVRRSHFAVNALIEGDDAADLAASAERAARDGFMVVKTKVAARPLAVEAQRLLAVRRAVGPKVRIRIDANGGWSEATARSALRGLEALDLEVCEQPVHSRDVEGLRRLRHLAPCRIAADESMLLEGQLSRLFERDPHAAADVVVLKPAALGGLLSSLAVAQQAHDAGVGAYVTTLMDGPIARAAAAHLAAILPSADWAHGLSTVELFQNVEADAFSPRNGHIALPQATGWGVR
jgi:o-succinylbenzoate synthase